MNDLGAVRARPVAAEALNYGLSPPHARINTMECILKIACNMSFASWTCTHEHVEERNARLQEIQDQFRERLGLLISYLRYSKSLRVSTTKTHSRSTSGQESTSTYTRTAEHHKATRSVAQDSPSCSQNYQRKSPRKCRTGTIAMFADDIIIIYRSRHQLQKMLDIVGEHLQNEGLRLNSEKTVVMKIRRGGHLGAHDRIKWKGKPLDSCQRSSTSGSVSRRPEYVSQNITKRFAARLWRQCTGRLETHTCCQ